MLAAHDGHTEHLVWNFVQVFVPVCDAVKQHVVYNKQTVSRQALLVLSHYCRLEIL